MNSQRSPLRLNRQEILIAISAVVAAPLYLYLILWGTPPFDFFDLGLDNVYLPGFVRARQQLFVTFAVPTTIILAISAVSLVRGIQGNVRGFSSMGHFSLTWPLISFPLFGVNVLVGLLSSPIGICLALIALVQAIRSKSNWGNLVGLLWNAGWLFLCIAFTIQFLNIYVLNIYGD